MASEICNQGLGDINGTADRVNNNDPANAVLSLSLWVSTATDATIRDVDDIAALEATALVTEAADGSYARIVLDDTDIGATTVDDGADTRSFDIADQVWSSLAGGELITKMAVGYDSDSTGGTDANIVLFAHYDFVVTPNGGDVTAQINASGLWSATQA